MNPHTDKEGCVEKNLTVACYLQKNRAERNAEHEYLTYAAKGCNLCIHTVIQVKQKAAHVFVIHFSSSVCLILRNNLKETLLVKKREAVLGL